MGKTFFSKDGSYGDAAGLIVIDTTNWTIEDWNYVNDGINDIYGNALRWLDKKDKA
jgi:hypothetical protein